MRNAKRVKRDRRALIVYLSRQAPAFQGSYHEIRSALGYRSGCCLKADLDALAGMGYVALPSRMCHPSVIRILVPFVETGATT